MQEQQKEEEYVRIAREAAEREDILGTVQKFAKQYGLQGKRVLEVGAGRGYLQDVVTDYTGLDISPTAQRYFHKPFVQASATEMPFRNGEFDAIWTIWVLEHIPNPESALREMRRVVKPGGVILLKPAWQCSSLAAEGYRVRPYSDFNLFGKLQKMSVPLRHSPSFLASYILPTRCIRYVASAFGNSPTSFHYRRLTPNYETYWEPDSDAVNSMDPYEAVLWFTSRGDKCLNCLAGLKGILNVPGDLVIQIGSTEFPR